LTFMGWLSLGCNLIFFAPIAFSPDIVVSFLTGGSGASKQLRQSFQQLPGITSFISACLPFFALYSATTIGDKAGGISRANHRLFTILFLFVAARALLGSERLALVEACVAYGIPRAAFVWRPGWFRTSMPFVGLGGVFALFSVGEYFRSWQFYKDYYDSYYDFVTVRFFGYFATSLNNGAGVVTFFPPLGMPGQTATGFYSLLRIIGIAYAPGVDVLNNYLNRYATPEFNTPGGLYVPYMDYGIVIGLFVFVVMGIITGWLYRQFISRKPIGLLLYPSWFLALLDIIRTWIWGGNRFVPVIIVTLLAAMILQVKNAPQGKGATS
jgi:oligosaccharide repeat unit polymerase